MLDLNLTVADHKAFLTALADPHNIRVDVAVLTLDEDELSRISPVVLDGQVNVDADADVTRMATLQFLDPSHSLQIDSDSPDDGALYADRLIQIVYSVNVPALTDRVDVEVCTGSVVAFERDADVVSLTIHGKEELAMGWIWRILTIEKGARRVDAIRSILGVGAGETNFDIPDLPSKLPKDLSLGRAAQPWARAHAIAQAMNRQLYYDGRGTCRMRIRPRRPVFTFLSDSVTGANITSGVRISHDFSTIKNAVWFKGGKPRGQQKAVQVFVQAPETHPLNPFKLGRTNVDGDRIPRYLVEEHTNEHVRTEAECRTRAEALLDDRLVETLGVEFTALPIPHLDPLDVVRVATSDFSTNVRIRQFSLPLAGGDMTVGYLAPVSRPARNRIRHRSRKAER